MLPFWHRAWKLTIITAVALFSPKNRMLPRVLKMNSPIRLRRHRMPVMPTIVMPTIVMQMITAIRNANRKQLWWSMTMPEPIRFRAV